MELRSRRKLSERGKEFYETEVVRFRDKLLHKSQNVETLISKINLQANLYELSMGKREIIDALNAYQNTFDEYKGYLTRCCTEESNIEAFNIVAKDGTFRNTTNNFIMDIDMAIVRLAESSSTKSSKRSTKTKSSVSSKKIEAEAAGVRLRYAREEANLINEKAAIESKLRVLGYEREAAVTAVEAANVADSDNSSRSGYSISDIPEVTPQEKVASFVKQFDPIKPVKLDPTAQVFHPTSMVPDSELHPTPMVPDSKLHPTPMVPDSKLYSPPAGPELCTSPIVPKSNPTHVVPVNPKPLLGEHQEIPIPSTDFSKYLLRKDLVVSRLTCFDDKPENYRAWRASFKSVISDLEVSASEEIDLLVKHLGNESKKHAISLRSVYVNNPKNGCVKIWSRLEERYGSPELVKHAIVSKLKAFPRINPKEPKKMYELVDILGEIEALKQDPSCYVQLAYFDSSEGILPIVHKLPYGMQEKWASKASAYKTRNNNCFPPFAYFIEFVNDLAKTKNDPGLACSVPTEKTVYNSSKQTMVASCKMTDVDTSKTEQKQSFRCPIHKANHSLVDCKVFKAKSVSERKKIVKESGVCFRCLESTMHRSINCKKWVKCSVCGSPKHLSLMHVEAQTEQASTHSKMPPQGGESTTSSPPKVDCKCSQICGDPNNEFGKSCAKVVLVDLASRNNPSHSIRTYAILDDQSNRSLASPKLFEMLDLQSESTQYTLNTCSGPVLVEGLKTSDCVVKSIDGTCSYSLPSLLECNQIPDSKSEIPTPEIATCFPHLQDIASQIPALDAEAEVTLLIGRDVTAVHHVHDQIVGSDDTPFAQRLSLGWVIVGQVCLGQIHLDRVVNCNKTYLLANGRPSVFEPCPNNISVDEHILPSCSRESVFATSKHDNEIGPSVEDREFLELMGSEMKKDVCGKWIAPLPFRSPRPTLPNNKAYAQSRASVLHQSLMKNPQKREHMREFMAQILDKGHAEVAPPLTETKECWYLPLFGVYHPKKPDKIRGVFDASAKFDGIALNDVLLQGPDFINNLVGVLLRFRKNAVAVSADIQQMFYSFLVEEKDRDFLRFFWYADNDPTKEMIEYRMKVHVFGNRPSPSVANYGLRKTAEVSESEFGADVCRFVANDFYVDDGLTSTPTATQAVDLMKRTQTALDKNGGIRLHKIASNSEQVMDSFPKDDLAKDLASLDLSKDFLPVQRSLGLSWCLGRDCFTFLLPETEKPFTRRGVLSVINSVYDPMGFVSPVTITGKILMKTMMTDKCGWDEPLSDDFLTVWKDWSQSLNFLQHLMIPRTYFERSLSLMSKLELVVFSDASEKAIASVAYLVAVDSDSQLHSRLVMGKAKVAPTSGHSIPRLELCAAVLAVQLSDFITEHLDVEIQRVYYFTDSKVVLGYIFNRTRRFYTYVANRVARILASSQSSQWSYVETKYNPADVGTRGVSSKHLADSLWLRGPPSEVLESRSQDLSFPLQRPEDDKELRPDVLTMTSKIDENNSSLLTPERFQRFSSFSRLVRAISNLQHVSSSFKNPGQCSGWHLCSEASSKQSFLRAQNYIVKVFQLDAFKEEIRCLREGKPLSPRSRILSLNPFLNEEGVLVVGGRLKHSKLPVSEKHPMIIPGDSYLSQLLIRHFHEKVFHQGRHFTEGTIRANGFWIVGGKRRVSSYLYRCVVCRKLRGKHQCQIMSDLPPDRLTPAPPFTYVGVDVFGPWNVISRKTRGGQASSKRWAVLFTCLTIRAIHIEVIAEMSSSAFINALRRFIAIRGEVVEFRSDRGTNFVGAVDDIGVQAINVEDRTIQKVLNDGQIRWVFNPPHASHMGGVWERMIGVVRRIIDSILTGIKNLTHDVLVTLMAEASAVVNARPLVPVSSDSENPQILSPSMLLTQKDIASCSFAENLCLKDMYRAEWKRVQVLANQFWYRWRSEFLSNLQSRRKWKTTQPDLKEGDVVLLKEETVARNQWPLALIIETFPSSDSRVRSVKVRTISDGKRTCFTRPVTQLILLLNE